MRTVYLVMSADIIHHGHINIIREARKIGRVIVGVLTDEVIATYKRFPLLDYHNRVEIISNISGVYEIIKQDTLDYTENLYKIKPDYVVHGDDWKRGQHKDLREKVIQTLEKWGGQVIDIPYTEGVSITNLEQKLSELGTTPQVRRGKLRKLLTMKSLVRIIEAHNGLTGLIAENTKVTQGEKIKTYDGIWISSLCDSVAKGKPDIELVDFTSRLNTLNEILEVTTKPIILDGDTGGKIEHFIYTVRTLERLGVSAIVIEDKVGLKKNSLFGTNVNQMQDSIENFQAKIKFGKEAQVTEEFMIIARVESLILKKGLEDAIQRTMAYIDAGADGIMIHSKEKEPNEIIEFCKYYKTLKNKVPLIVVPSTYNKITEKELIKAGVNIVIYANQLMRSAYPAILKTAETILKHERSYEAEEFILPINELINLIPGGK